MKTKTQRIDLLLKFMRGEVPASALKDHTLTWLHLLTPDQRTLIEAKVGRVLPSNCSIYNQDETLIGFWDGIPIGATAMFHLSMFAHPDCFVQTIDCSNTDAFSRLLSSLRQKQLTNERPDNHRRAH